MNLGKLYLLLTFIVYAPKVYAWGAAGHEIIATIAQMHLYPDVLPTICSILYPPSSDSPAQQELATNCNLASVATWADRIRNHMRWSAPLHYVGGKGDHPPQTCLFPGPDGWDGRKDINVLGAIRNTTNVLANAVLGGRLSNDLDEPLKFLVHFMGDMHMPLHLTGRDRGGNGDKVLWDGRVTNFHSLWDGLIIAKAIRTTPNNYSRPLPDLDIERHLRGAIYDPFIRKIVWDGISNKWAHEIESWIECPAVQTRENVQVSFWEQTKQFFLGTEREAMNTDDDVICPYHWAKPIHQLNCDFIWPTEMDKPPYRHGVTGGDEDHISVSDEELHELMLGRKPRGGPYLELDTAKYAGRIAEEWVVERLLAMAGIRLAGVLNWLFAK